MYYLKKYKFYSSWHFLEPFVCLDLTAHTYVVLESTRMKVLESTISLGAF